MTQIKDRFQNSIQETVLLAKAGLFEITRALLDKRQ